MRHVIGFEFDAPEDVAVAIYANLDDQSQSWAVENLNRRFATQYEDKP